MGSSKTWIWICVLTCSSYMILRKLRNHSKLQVIHRESELNRKIRGWPRSPVVNSVCSASMGQGWDPGRGHCTAHQAMLRPHPTQYNQKDPQLKYTTIYNWGDLGRKKQEKKKRRLATVVSSGANLEKGKKPHKIFKTTVWQNCWWPIQIPLDPFSQSCAPNYQQLNTWLLTAHICNLQSMNSQQGQ